ncbi:uncharacterized protein LOC143179083 [Calliopsis andreniformis]|uniref:uncharacterized protein LOC143179083 n=1 Tax=Calliopsis andreniformis TaxID=337506 RepID=UPI003FCD5128
MRLGCAYSREKFNIWERKCVYFSRRRPNETTKKELCCCFTSRCVRESVLCSRRAGCCVQTFFLSVFFFLSPSLSFSFSLSLSLSPPAPSLPPSLPPFSLFLSPHHLTVSVPLSPSLAHTLFHPFCFCLSSSIHLPVCRDERASKRTNERTNAHGHAPFCVSISIPVRRILYILHVANVSRTNRKHGECIAR